MKNKFTKCKRELKGENERIREQEKEFKKVFFLRMDLI